jgi:uncharacterized protein (TIGR02145 family)
MPLILSTSTLSKQQIFEEKPAVFASVVIGNQEWMTSNWLMPMPKSWFYGNDSTLDAVYGKLYYYSNALAAAPKGWHLPTMDDWWELINYLGGPNEAAVKMMEGGSSGLNLVAGGFKSANISPDDLFSFKDKYAFYWTATPDGDQTAYGIHLTKGSNDIEIDSYRRANGFSVRYIKDR